MSSIVGKFALLLLCLTGSAFGVDNPDAPDRVAEFYKRMAPLYADVREMANSSAEISAGYARIAKALDTELNAAYKNAMAGLAAPEQQLLRDSQRAWLAFRDSEFRLVREVFSNARFGSSAGMSRDEYATTLVSNRVVELLRLPNDGTPPAPQTAAARTESTSLTLSEEGIGPVNARTSFDLAVMKKLFPGYTVTRKTETSEGEPFPVLSISDRRGVVLKITPAEGHKAIFSVLVLSDRVGYAGDSRIGSTYATVYGTRAAAGCVPGQEEMSGAVICPAPGSRRISLVFRGRTDGPDGRIPPYGTLKAWRISVLAWKP